MSSGVGIFTKKGRCYPFWEEFLKCKHDASNPFVECKVYIEDYNECLHHRKERARMIQIIKQLEKKSKETEEK